MAKLETPIYVISNMSAKLSASNVQVINQLTELYFEDVENVTYQDLVNARTESLGSGFGYPEFKDGVEFWVLPSIAMGLTVDPNSPSIKEYTKQEYRNNIMPFWDVENIEDF